MAKHNITSDVIEQVIANLREEGPEVLDKIDRIEITNEGVDVWWQKHPTRGELGVVPDALLMFDLDGYEVYSREASTGDYYGI
jgi:hypothetical protein